MDMERPGPFGVADVKPYAVPYSLDELQGPDHGVVALPKDVAWSGRHEFDLDDEYDRAAMYKIVLEEGQEADQRRLLNWRILRRDWRNLFPARQVRALWEDRSLSFAAPNGPVPARVGAARA